MTKMLDQAIEAVRTLSPEEQDEIARAIMAQVKYSQEAEEDDLSDEELAAIDNALEAVKNGQVATDEEVEAAFRAFRK